MRSVMSVHKPPCGTVQSRGLVVIVLALNLLLAARSWSLSSLYTNGPQLPPQSFNVQDYGAKGNSSHVSTRGSMNSGSATLTCPDCYFSNADVGKKVYIYGASSAADALSLGSNIQSIQSSTSATLATPATRTT